METLKAIRAWTEVLKTLRYHRCWPRLLYPARLSIPIDGERHSTRKPNCSSICLPVQLYRRYQIKENFDLKRLISPYLPKPPQRINKSRPINQKRWWKGRTNAITVDSCLLACLFVFKQESINITH